MAKQYLVLTFYQNVFPTSKLKTLIYSVIAGRKKNIINIILHALVRKREGLLPLK